MADPDNDDDDEDSTTVEVNATEYPYQELQALLGARLDDEDLAMANQFLMALLEDIGGTQFAVDSNITLQKGISMDVSGIVRRVQALRAAEAEVEAIVGEIVGMDSADRVYLEALKRLGHPTAGLAGAGQAAFRMARTGGARPGLAMDAAAMRSFEERFPHSGRLKR